MANLLSKIVSGNAGMSDIPIAPNTLRTFLRAQPAYSDNRERAAVVLGQGFGVYDTLVANKTLIFLAAAANAVFSAYMLKKRRRSGGEAVALWSISLAASAGVAWVARPGTTDAPPPGMTGAQATDFGIVSMIDHKREALRQKNPGFADDVFRRLTSMPGIREPLDANPLVKAAIV